jgi:hypothetical protein
MNKNVAQQTPYSMRGVASMQHFVLHQHCSGDTDAAPQTRSKHGVDRYGLLKTHFEIDNHLII